ncbi:TonB-dependent receptor [Seongchinamella sediminis]|uniref:TonB-dependent receptor n=1 Tax=Seongchinamella sediminis TaxID=2283635 RepID=UPI0013C36A9D|nr:TonB-dependent receptor [Seongchinamella sediminis]
MLFARTRPYLATAIVLGSMVSGITPVAAEERATALEEVIVTARRRAESLQDVPVSVTAFSAAEIEAIGITNVGDISQLTPNLIIQPNTSGNDGVLICMRGLCRTDYTITEDPMVGIYLDGVYVGKSIGSLFDLAELERVEVLRGPQGTLYGKNTLGGAVLLHTRKPSGDWGGTATFTGGNYDRRDAKGYLEFPITDDLAGSVSYLYRSRDPYVENSLGGDRWSEDNQAVRAALRWEAADTVTIDYALDWQEKDELPLAPQISSASGSVCLTEAGIICWGLGDLFGDDVREDYADKVHTYSPSHSKVDLLSHSLTMDFGLSDRGAFQDMAFKSITAYRDVDSDVLNNNTGASSAYLISKDAFDYQSVSQEFQLSGGFSDGFGEFVLGAFYFNEDGEYTNDQEINAFQSHAVSTTEVDNTSWALFTEVTLNVTDKFAVTGGVRYTDEEREAGRTATDLNSGFTFFDTYNQTYGGFPADYDTRIDATNTSPRLSLSYHFTDDMMTFFTYAKGFKSGGFNARSFTPLQWGPYDDMETDSYELGAKSMWWQNRLQVNVTGFYQELTDMQAQVNAIDPNGQVGFSAVIQNAAEATVIGAEVEVIAQLTEGLNINAGYGYTDAEYDEFESFDPLTGIITDISDDRAFEFTPKDSYHISLDYAFPQFFDNGRLYARLDWAGQGKIHVTPKISGNQDLVQESYDLINARLTYGDIALGDGTLMVSLWGNNLTDEAYKIGGYEIDAGDPAFGGIGRTGISQWGEPRTYGLDVTYRFGTLGN